MFWRKILYVVVNTLYMTTLQQTDEELAADRLTGVFLGSLKLIKTNSAAGKLRFSVLNPLFERAMSGMKFEIMDDTVLKRLMPTKEVTNVDEIIETLLNEPTLFTDKNQEGFSRRLLFKCGCALSVYLKEYNPPYSSQPDLHTIFIKSWERGGLILLNDAMLLLGKSDSRIIPTQLKIAAANNEDYMDEEHLSGEVHLAWTTPERVAEFVGGTRIKRKRGEDMIKQKSDKDRFIQLMESTLHLYATETAAMSGMTPEQKLECYRLKTERECYILETEREKTKQLEIMARMGNYF